MNIQDIQQNILAGGGTLFLLMTLVQISPIKINPWSAIGRVIKKFLSAIGAIINSGLISKVDALGEKVDGIEKRFEKHEASVAESKADERRADILRFNREIIRGLPHTMEDFIEVLSYIDFYESYCRDHPEYENNRAVMAIQNIEEAYQEHLSKNDFS